MMRDAGGTTHTWTDGHQTDKFKTRDKKNDRQHELTWTKDTRLIVTDGQHEKQTDMVVKNRQDNSRRDRTDIRTGIDNSLID